MVLLVQFCLFLRRMRKSIVENLLNSAHSDGDQLPSVRALMNAFKASSATVQAALRMLENDGKIHCVHGKGNFWGYAPQKVVIPAAHETAEKRLARLFVEDFEKGFLSPKSPLPMLKELQARYQVSPLVLRMFLAEQVRLCVLQKEGRKYTFVKKLEPRSRMQLTEILFVTRCNPWGSFAAESEREMDFLRSVYRRAGSSRYKLILLGYSEERQVLMDRNGRECRLTDFPNAVGAVVSTLLVMNPLPMVQLFSKVSYPVSIWWEHPDNELPKAFLKKENWLFFNSSFGRQPGVEMGKFLQRRGVTSIVYFSPYHSSSWSKDRLLGLEQAGLNIVPAIDAEMASPWDFRQLAKQKVEKYAVESYARELTRQKMLELVNHLPERAKVLPWVCVNDEVANTLIEIADTGAIPLSEQIFGFDNSAESYLLRLPSYDFNTETLVEQMFYAIECPSDFLNIKALKQIRGTVVEK